jgi:light-regulated signal transduction histidine kinase (bacteriophytochrome)
LSAGSSRDDEGITRKPAPSESLRAASEEADAANRAWDSFSHVLGHDLRAPLRCIDGFGQALLEDHGDKLGDEGREYLRYIREAAREMVELIDALVTLSQVTRSAMHVSQIDLSAVARRTIARLCATNCDRHVETIIAPDLVAVGDSEQLGLAIEHLLGNAWKFTSKCALARIEFGASVVDGEQAYFVRDNGVGFDQAYASKLFGLFQRLHPPGELPGAGSGLAIA